MVAPAVTVVLSRSWTHGVKATTYVPGARVTEYRPVWSAVVFATRCPSNPAENDTDAATTASLDVRLRSESIVSNHPLAQPAWWTAYRWTRAGNATCTAATCPTVTT